MCGAALAPLALILAQNDLQCLSRPATLLGSTAQKLTRWFHTAHWRSSMPRMLEDHLLPSVFRPRRQMQELARHVFFVRLIVRIDPLSHAGLDSKVLGAMRGGPLYIPPLHLHPLL